jgi:spore maturation protein CgeB
MATDKPQGMAKTRALLTETEREQIAGEHGRDRRYQATSRVRSRIKEELSKDVEVLAEHHPDLLEELREVVCEEGGDE